MNKCIGCGAILTTNISEEGYTPNIESNLCQRCFKIRNYNEYQVILKDNTDYIKILNNIPKNSLVILVVDLLNINNKISEIGNIIKNKILLVLTKYDLLPSNNEEKFINFFNSFNLNIVDTVIISSQNNFHFDILFQKIKQLKQSNDVYVVGYTNAGKSSMINRIIRNYSNGINYITTSNLPSTTINTIEIKIEDWMLIDTPGLLDNSILNYVGKDILKKIIPLKKIKPLTYQMKSFQTIKIEDILMVSCEKTNLTMYFSNQLNIQRYYKKLDNTMNLTFHQFNVLKNQEIVILGLGFIHFSNDTLVNIFVIGNTDVFVRTSLIGR